MRHRFGWIIWGGLVCGNLISEARGGDAPQQSAPRDPTSPSASRKVNLKTKTYGGVQFWGDVQFFHGWHIQQNVFTKHYRLLDHEDRRHAWGTLSQCRAKLDEIRKTEKLPAMSGEAVILIHGLGRSDKSLRELQAHLRQQGYTVIGFNYPSTRVELAQAAEYLHQVLESLEGIDTIHLVPFSMGGLVVRAYLAEHRDPRLGRMVMIGVPNQGADLAQRFHKHWAFRIALGPGAGELAAGPECAAAKLPAPDFEFAVIAGARGTPRGYNPLIPGDDDGTVSVACTRLPGADDFATIRGLHNHLMHAPETLDFTARFLKEGRLRKTGENQPIPAHRQSAPPNCDR